jgi:hypothetical protein
MTANAAFAERPEQKHDLLDVFQYYKQKFGDGDVGLMLTAMHIEALEQIAALETRLERLEQRRK